MLPPVTVTLITWPTSSEMVFWLSWMVPPLETYCTFTVRKPQEPEEEQTDKVEEPLVLPTMVKTLPLMEACTAALLELEDR